MLSARLANKLGMLLFAVVLVGGVGISPAPAQPATEPAEATVPAADRDAPEGGAAVVPEAAGEAASETGEVVTRPGVPIVWFVAPICAIVALVFARKFYKEVKAADEGDPEMGARV